MSAEPRPEQLKSMSVPELEIELTALSMRLEAMRHEMDDHKAEADKIDKSIVSVFDEHHRISRELDVRSGKASVCSGCGAVVYPNREDWYRRLNDGTLEKTLERPTLGGVVCHRCYRSERDEAVKRDYMEHMLGGWVVDCQVNRGKLCGIVIQRNGERFELASESETSLRWVGSKRE